MPKAGFLRACAALCALLALPLAVLAAQQSYRIAPPGSWVRPVTPDVTIPLPDGAVTGGYEFLLIDAQEAVREGAELERYRHIAYRLLDQSAVEERSQIEVSFDPTYERLILHSAAVIREGRTIDQLKPGRVRVLSRESNRDYLIYSGRVYAVLVLEDVREGDVVAYSFTRVGSNPVFRGHYSGVIAEDQSVPVHFIQYRLLWPRNRPLHVQQHQTSTQPTVTESGTQREYLWQSRDLRPRVVDPNVPAWYDPYPWIQLSDFPSWKAVAAWGDTLFSTPGQLPASLRQVIERIRTEHPTEEARAVAALRYAQEQVRYLGIEIGINSHQPYPISTVLQRGYGDCKDKVQLLLAMLRELGIEARPALVSTDYGRHLARFHPTAAFFDHVIVQLTVDGETHWVDPTATNQRGDLRSASAQLGGALVLGRSTDSITAIASQPAAEPLTEIRSSFQLGKVDSQSTLTIETDYRGASAVEMRARKKNTSLDQLQREYTKYYSSNYPGLQAVGSLTIDDHEATNVVQTMERYTIPKFWVQETGQPGYIGSLEPLELYGAIPSVSASDRTMPLAIYHPHRLRYVVSAQMDAGWGIAARVDSVRTPALRLVRTIGVEAKTLTLSYEYESLADHVKPEDTPAHMEQLARLRDLIPYHVTPPPADGLSWADPDQFNWFIVLVVLVTLAVTGYAAVRIYRAPPPNWPAGPLPPNPPGEELTGLQGWLVLVGIGLIVTPLTVLHTIYQGLPAYAKQAWDARTTAGMPSYHALWGPTLVLELVTNIALVVFGVLLLKLFFERKRWFPALFVIVGIGRVVLLLIDSILANQVMPPAPGEDPMLVETLRGVLLLLVWGSYMAKSRRVRNTFTT